MRVKNAFSENLLPTWKKFPFLLHACLPAKILSMREKAQTTNISSNNNIQGQKKDERNQKSNIGKRHGCDVEIEN